MHALYGDGGLPLSAYGASDFSCLELVRELCATQAPEPARWRIDADADLTATWITVGHGAARPPDQGWKLHVSASVWSAEEVLRRALAVLLADPVLFKVAASTGVLSGLNDGTSGSLSQIGKFITVYPMDDDQAVRLSLALDEATWGLSGPPVPSDRPLRRGSLVHYRYGGFGGMFIQTPIGEITPAVRTPAGDVVPDVRSTAYQPPDWAGDPFEAAGAVQPSPPGNRVIAGRYAIAMPLHESPRGAVHLALDVQVPASCVLKQARAGAQPAPDGSDARDRLRHEASVLDPLAPDDRFPRVLELVEQDDDLFLAMTDVPGRTLEDVVGTTIRRGELLPAEQVLDLALQLASVVGTIHAAGYVYRDLKPTNVIVAEDGRARVVDFEMARAPGTHDEPGPGLGRFGLGTRGYMSPQQAAGHPPAVTDDVFSLGALLYLLATGAEPSRSPHPFALLERPVRHLNPAVDPVLADVVERCLDPDPAGRFPTAAAVAAALTPADASAASSGTTDRGTSSARPARDRPQSLEPLPAATCRELACRLADTLCADARPVGDDGTRVAWVSPHKTASGLRSRDLYVGSGGSLLALADLVDALGETAHRHVLAAGARWLAEAPAPTGPPLAGLYVGESGVAAALLRAGQVLDDTGLIGAASARGEQIAGLPFTSPDLMNGTAGRVRFHLLLWDHTAAPQHLAHAIAAGEHLVTTVQDVGGDECRWVIPEGYGDLSGTAPLGYAHGAAGTADVLLDLYEATGDERFAVTAEKAARWLAEQAIPALDDRTGLAWPMIPGGEPMPAYWCHGAAGIGRFFLHAARLDLWPDATELGIRAARTTAHGIRWAGPTPCHGLAGAVDLLIEAYQAVGDPSHLVQAGRLATLLATFRTEDDGRLRWPSDWPWVFGPDWMVGYAGVALTLLRLAESADRPHPLSRAGFRHHRTTPAHRHSPSAIRTAPDVAPAVRH